MAPSDSSPTKLEDGLGNEKSQKEISSVGIQGQIDNEAEIDKNAEPSDYAGSSNLPGSYPYLPERSFSPPSDDDFYGYDYEDMYAERAQNSTYVYNRGSLREVCDENSHVDGGHYGEDESTRVIYVPSPKVDVVVGAVATLRYLQPNFGDRIRILKDSVEMKCAKRPVEIIGKIAQIEFAEQLINAVLSEVQENHVEPMEEETKKPSSQKDGEALNEEVHAELPECDAATSPRT